MGMALEWSEWELPEELVGAAAGELVIYTTTVDSTTDPPEDIEDLLRRPGVSLEADTELEPDWTISTTVLGHHYRFEQPGTRTVGIAFLAPGFGHAHLIYFKTDPGAASAS